MARHGHLVLGEPDTHWRAVLGQGTALRQHHVRVTQRYNCFHMMSDARASHPGADELAVIVYNELRRIAAAYMRGERPGFPLQATGLVHEAYLRLAGSNLAFKDESHVVGIAARSMRPFFVYRARARGAQKRWAGLDRVSLPESLVGAHSADSMLPEMDVALMRLEQIEPEQARIIELRYFVGLSVEDAAAVLKISPATLKRRFARAHVWLFRELEGRRARRRNNGVRCGTCSSGQWTSRRAPRTPGLHSTLLTRLSWPQSRRSSSSTAEPALSSRPRSWTKWPTCWQTTTDSSSAQWLVSTRPSQSSDAAEWAGSSLPPTGALAGTSR